MITENQITELLKEMKQLEKWGSNKLAQMWFILQTPWGEDDDFRF